MMLAKNKTIGRNRKVMKVEWEFYKDHRVIELLPCITLWWWNCRLYGVVFSWLRWGIDIQILRSNNACR